MEVEAVGGRLSGRAREAEWEAVLEGMQRSDMERPVLELTSRLCMRSPSCTEDCSLVSSMAPSEKELGGLT